jgi:hypothetical protein
MISAGAAAPAFSLQTLHEFYKRLIMDLMFSCYHSFERYKSIRMESMYGHL